LAGPVGAPLNVIAGLKTKADPTVAEPVLKKYCVPGWRPVSGTW
jgi:hypothetical protein